LPLANLHSWNFYLLFEIPVWAYYSTDVNLEITFDKPTSWIGYSLDVQQTITISNRETPYQTPYLGNSLVNASLKGLSIGSHSITFYANDTFGHMGSETIDFSVAKPSVSEKPSIENLSSVAIAIISVTVAIVCLIVALFLFRRHRKTADLSK